MESGEIRSLQLRRAKFLEHFANRAACLIGMEACGGSQHWARELQKLGHEVKPLSARMVKAFVSGNKNDAADARAIWTAVQQPGIKAVAVKSEGQQAVLALHRMRAQLVKFRTAQVNGLRGLLAEYGEVMPQGRAGIRRDVPAALGRLAERLPAVVIDTLREQYGRVGELDEQVQQIERRLQHWHRDDQASRRLAAIPGVGLLGATAAIATIGDAKVFKSGREFAAWLGLVPRQSGTGGRDSTADFSDALIATLGRNAGCEHTLTFDRAAARHPGFALLKQARVSGRVGAHCNPGHLTVARGAASNAHLIGVPGAGTSAVCRGNLHLALYSKT